MGRPRKYPKVEKPLYTKWDRDPNDCHHLPYLDEWLGVRAIITTTKGIVRGRLVYKDGYYICDSGQLLVDGEWVYRANRFIFRKGEFKNIVRTPTEDSVGR